MLKLICLITLMLFSKSIGAKEQEQCLNFHVIHSEPLGYLDERGNVIGIHADTLKEIAKYTGLCINTILMPYSRIWQSMEAEKHDGGIVFRSESRSHIVDYVALIRAVKVAVVARKPIELNSYDDLSAISIVIRRKVHLSDKFDNNSALAKMEVNNYDQVINMLMYDRIDAIAGSVFVLHYILRNVDGLDKVDFSKKLNLGTKE